MIKCAKYVTYISDGFFHDCAVHDLDLTCWILNDYPISVYALAHAHTKDFVEMQDSDSAVICLKFDSGVIASIDISRHACYGYDQRCEVSLNLFYKYMIV